MNRVKRHHYVCVTGLIINSLSTLLLFFNFIFHDLPHGVHIVISGERESSTKDKTQEKWRSSRKERIPFTCHQSYHPSLFSHAVYFFLHDSQRLQQALTSSLIANYLGRKMSVSPFGIVPDKCRKKGTIKASRLFSKELFSKRL